MEAGRPRALYFGNNLEISQRINRTNMEKVKKEDIPIQIPELEDTPHLRLLSQYLKGVQISPKQIFNYNRNFENENDIFLKECDEKQMELFSDYVSHELEKMNVCEGFELMIDCETAYGSIGLSVIDLLNDLQGSKSPKFVMALLDSGDEPNRVMNKVLTLTSYQQCSNVLVPLEMKDLNLKLGNTEQQLSFLVSNITSPYKCIDDHVRMYDFCQRITPAPQNNIFNVLVRVPTLLDQPDDSILNFKKSDVQKLNKMHIQEPIVEFVSHYESFGESYFMRGLSPIPNDRTLNSYGIDIRLIDYVYLVPQEYELQDNTIPFHSCLFSNECYKHSLHQLFNKFDKLKKSAFLQYEKSSLEDVQELKHGLQSLLENYGGIDDVQQQ